MLAGDTREFNLYVVSSDSLLLEQAYVKRYRGLRKSDKFKRLQTSTINDSTKNMLCLFQSAKTWYIEFCKTDPGPAHLLQSFTRGAATSRASDVCACIAYGFITHVITRHRTCMDEVMNRWVRECMD